jgi:hypothetical protein
MHSAEELAEHQAVEGLDDNQLRRELIDARREIADLKANNEEQFQTVTALTQHKYALRKALKQLLDELWNGPIDAEHPARIDAANLLGDN